MRVLPIALLGIVVAIGPALAAREGAGTARTRLPAPAASQHASAPARAEAPARQAAPSRRNLGATQDRRAATANACPRGVARCGPPRRAGWMSGLPPAAGVQMAGCPAGTMATLALGHSDVVRCMPF